MTHPYKTREGGATVTIFVPYDCRNHCPFCVNKQEYAHAEGFSVEAILKSIAVMDEITLRFCFHRRRAVCQLKSAPAHARRHPHDP